MPRHALRAVASAFTLATALALPAAGQTGSTLIKHAAVFDGNRLLGKRDVLVVNGRIARIATSITAPAGETSIDATGKTLLPGFIDAHTHSWDDALEQALAYGVTTSLDMFTAPAEAAARRAEQRAGNVASRADLFSAGVLATAPGGHGSEYGIPIPTVSGPEVAQAFVDTLVKQGSDYVKIVIDDGSAYGPRRIPTLSPASVAALVRAAHARGKLAVVHVGTLADAHVAIDAGADALVHLFTDRAPEPGFGKYVAQHHAFVIPTLTVLNSIVGQAGGTALSKDARLAPWISPATSSTLLGSFPFAGNHDIKGAEDAVRQLVAAGVPVLAGTDAPNPGTGHGISLHQELENLVHAGLTPTQALTAATAATARAFRLTDRGVIAVGRRADLVLVNGDPTRDILATRDIAGIWKGGVPLDRVVLATRYANARAAAAAGPRLGLVSDFDAGKPSASFGSGWYVTTDAFFGGKSTAKLAVVTQGAHASNGALEVQGNIAAGASFLFGGVMFMPGKQPMASMDLSAARSFAFMAKGDGRAYKVMIFTRSKGNTPVLVDFSPTKEWAEYSFAFSDFDGMDGHDIMGIAIVAVAPAGAFTILIDDFRIR